MVVTGRPAAVPRGRMKPLPGSVTTAGRAPSATSTVCSVSSLAPSRPGKPGEQLDLVVLAVGQAADAQAVVDHAQRRLHLRLDADVVAVLHVAGGQRLVEAEAGLAVGAAAVDAEPAIGERLAGRGGRLGDLRGASPGVGAGGGVVGVAGVGVAVDAVRGGADRSSRVARLADEVARDARSQHQSHDQGSQRRPIHENPRRKRSEFIPPIV